MNKRARRSSSTTDQSRWDSNEGTIEMPMTYPPVESCAGDVGAWMRRLESPVYRRRVKRAVQQVQAYRMLVRGDDRLTKEDRVAVHRLLDTLTFDSNRRTRRGGDTPTVLLGETPVSID